VVRFHDDNGDGDLLDVGDNTRYYTTDANQNVTATIDAATGDVVERYVYNAYGKATVYDDAWANPAAPTVDGPLYCGYFFDAETGLYQVRNRYYDSGLSTFVSRDPAEDDRNLYRYVGNNPVLLTDPSGLQQITPPRKPIPGLPSSPWQPPQFPSAPPGSPSYPSYDGPAFRSTPCPKEKTEADCAAIRKAESERNDWAEDECVKAEFFLCHLLAVQLPKGATPPGCSGFAAKCFEWASALCRWSADQVRDRIEARYKDCVKTLPK
jgi:RHS repeat-associated protein